MTAREWVFIATEIGYADKLWTIYASKCAKYIIQKFL